LLIQNRFGKKILMIRRSGSCNTVEDLKGYVHVAQLTVAELLGAESVSESPGEAEDTDRANRDEFNLNTLLIGESR
jgi:hypothetical protein